MNEARTSRQVTVVVRGVQLSASGNGLLRAALFLEPAGFPDNPLKAASRAILDLDDWLGRNPQASSTAHHDGGYEVRFSLDVFGSAKETDDAQRSSLEGLRLAVALFHDANSNGVLDKGLLGIPKEGFGFSANPQIWKGAPAFEDCVLAFDELRPSVVVKMKYLMSTISHGAKP